MPDTGGKKGVKILTRDILDNTIAKSGGKIFVQKIESDVSGVSVNMTGPWEYKNSRKCILHYTVIDREDIGPKSISVQDLLSRSFSKFETKITNSKKFKWGEGRRQLIRM